jgi:predicted ATP-grasp superfamily ATP-dependent carboligase
MKSKLTSGIIAAVLAVYAVLSGSTPAPAASHSAPAASFQGARFYFADKHLSDDAIHDLVKRKLANDPDVKGGALEIDVKEGVVTLRGKVETEKLKQKAERLAKKVSSVKKVVNEIQLSTK